MSQTNDSNSRLRHSICVSGASMGRTVEADHQLAARLGAAIAKSGHVVTTGATIGLPYYAARGAKQAGGMSVGFSPASSVREHVRKYRLPTKYFDFINYTGMNYVGRDLYLVQSSDAVITIGGRMGTMHEFTSALESNMPCGVLLGTSGVADSLPQLMDILEGEHKNKIIYDTNPEVLVEKIVALLDREYEDIEKDLQRDDFWFLETPDHDQPSRAG